MSWSSAAIFGTLCDVSSVDFNEEKIMPTMIKKSEIEQYIGHVCEPTDWLEVTQQQVNEFAECTMDRQFIHIDPVAAAKTPFGGTIAHGFLTLSMLSYFAETFRLVVEGIYMGVIKVLIRCALSHPFPSVVVSVVTRLF